MSVKFADFDFGARLCVLRRDAAKRDVLGQQRRAHGAGDDADLVPPNPHAIAMGGALVADQLKSDELALRVLLALVSAARPMKSSGFVFNGTVKPMPASNGSV